MSKYRFGSTSARRLATCTQDMQTLMVAAISADDCPVDFSVICGHRTEAEQNDAHARGASKLKWPRSRHNSYPSMACDVAPYVGGDVSWDWKYYHLLAPHIKATWSRLAAEGKVSGSLEWGGDWRSFKDGPHWQINL